MNAGPLPGEPAATFDIRAFQQLAAAADARALPMLQTLLCWIEQGSDIMPANGPGGVGVVRKLCAAIAHGVEQLFADPRLPVTPEDCDWLARYDQHLATVLRIARPSAPRRIARRVWTALKADKSGRGLKNLLAVSGIASGADVNWPRLLADQPETALPFFLANFTHRLLLEPAAESRRDGLFKLAPSVAGLNLRVGAMPVLSVAWMLSTYARASDRHALKAPLNGLVRDLLAREGIRPAPSPPKREKPTLVVVAEALRSDHAIYKTYAHFLGQLRRRFRLVLATLEGYADDNAKALFDQVIAPAWPKDAPWSTPFFKQLVAAIGGAGPAVVYFPAVGLSPFTVALANLRLAPVQVASVGHPATTGAAEIDYMVMGRDYFSSAELFSERVMLLRSGGALFQPQPTAGPITPVVRDKPDVLGVAIPASAMKISASFLGLCGRLARQCGRPVEFHFFPNLTGLRHLDCRREIEARLAGARVHPRLGFDAYMRALGRCDLRFGTYPFGGANTCVDGFLAALPTLVMEGPEPASRTDSRLVRLFGQPDWLIAGSEAAYERAALRLLSDDGERTALARAIIEAGPEKVLYSKEQDLYPTDFADCVWWLHRNHDKVKKSEKRAWTFEDRQSFTAE